MDDLRNALLALKESLMQAIQVAARQQHTHEILRLSPLAQQVEVDLATLAEIAERTQSFKDQLQTLMPRDRPEAMMHSPHGIAVLPSSTAAAVPNSSSKKRGMEAAKIARNAFVHTCKTRGISLLFQEKTIVSTPSGARIALPFAHEFPAHPDKWFLGVDGGGTPATCPYACIVFFCQGMDERLFTFIVPHQHLQQHWNYFSRHSGGVKFNIRREGVNFTLHATGGRYIRLNGYQDAYDHLKFHTSKPNPNTGTGSELPGRL